MENMVPTLEAIKGGGGSIKVGTTGTISALMSRELESTKSSLQTPISSRNKSPSVSISPIVSKRPMQRISPDKASSSSNNKKSLENVRKTKHNNRKTHQIPMLDSDNISLDGTPSRDKPDKRAYIVEVVDLKCGNPDRTWAPITNRLKKLGFSKLSESSDQLSGSGN
ncbi:hypothetical protein CEY00_Acc19419 [Actinidia chinensis var. chinensis]|uniref:Uncharacterized protein n=1 Tax=Actinidia chinensis var. chinensis TaxID=1590841 RepID=A0A2R6QDE2_ACTCC|nr:hypothetical protein CEY00_Acc19419 [Actinidia chinensis var. chinensis]